MKEHEDFYRLVKECAEKFKQTDPNETIRLITHLDADGISAGALFVKLLNVMGRQYSLSIVQQVNQEYIENLSKESYKYYVFTDIGCGVLSSLNDLMADREVFILDHHTPEEVDVKNHITVLNPHYVGVDGGQDISGSGVVFYFARAIAPEMEKMAHIGLIGAIGDVQDKDGFSKLNQEMIDCAVKHGSVHVTTGLRLFGAHTKPIHKTLEYSTDPYIPGVTGSESGAIQFLAQIGIDPKRDGKWKKVVNLDEDEMKKLVTGIILRRLGETKPEDVLGETYVLTNEPPESPTRDAKEFATLLNACGRMDRATLGIGACLGDPKLKQEAIDNLNEYKKEIIGAINWFHDNRKTPAVVEDNKFVIINAGTQIRSTIIGTLASIISKSSWLEDGVFVLSMAQSEDSMSKISMRMSGRQPEGVDLRDVVTGMVDGLEGCEAGGHQSAAGAIIPSSMEDVFLQKAREHLERVSMEEVVN